MPLFGRHAGMIVRRANAVGLKNGGHLLGIFAAEAIDDRRLAGVATEHFDRLRRPIDQRQDAIDQVRADRSCRPAPAGSRSPSWRDNVVADPRRGRRREGVQAGLRKPLREHGHLPIFGPKVVPPMADAMGLVDREPPHVDSPRRAAKTNRSPAAPERRNKQAKLPLGEARFRPRAVRRANMSAVQASRRIAARSQAIDLIFHQRNQRGDDDVGRIVQQRRHLIAQRLAAAGRHHHQRIASGQRRGDCLGLQGAQRSNPQ